MIGSFARSELVHRLRSISGMPVAKARIDLFLQQRPWPAHLVRIDRKSQDLNCLFIGSNQTPETVNYDQPSSRRCCAHITSRQDSVSNRVRLPEATHSLVSGRTIERLAGAQSRLETRHSWPVFLNCTLRSKTGLTHWSSGVHGFPPCNHRLTNCVSPRGYFASQF